MENEGLEKGVGRGERAAKGREMSARATGRFLANFAVKRKSGIADPPFRAAKWEYFVVLMSHPPSGAEKSRPQRLIPAPKLSGETHSAGGP
jgi:hypothetical protein